jgi:exonuclease SbcC
MELAAVDRDTVHLNSELDNIEKEVEHLSTKENPYQAKQNAITSELLHLQFEVKVADTTLEDQQARLRMLQYWVKGFKELRLYLIAEAMQQLEIEVNSCLSQLGLRNWKILFEVDKETKSGDLRKGFNVKIISPHNSAPVPWESWSGGESQRLRIATTMGLANLIKTSTGSTFNLEVWDEPTQHMSEQGVMDLLDSLAERSRSLNKQIWIVDHRSLGYGDFDSIKTIVKSAKNTTSK